MNIRMNEYWMNIMTYNIIVFYLVCVRSWDILIFLKNSFFILYMITQEDGHERKDICHIYGFLFYDWIARLHCYSSANKIYPYTHSELFTEYSKIDFSLLWQVKMNTMLCLFQCLVIGKATQEPGQKESMNFLGVRG